MAPSKQSQMTRKSSRIAKNEAAEAKRVAVKKAREGKVKRTTMSSSSTKADVITKAKSKSPKKKKKTAAVKKARPEKDPEYLFDHSDFNRDEYEVVWHEASGKYYDETLRCRGGQGSSFWRFFRIQLIQEKSTTKMKDGPKFVVWTKMGFIGGEDQARTMTRRFAMKREATSYFLSAFKETTGHAFLWTASSKSKMRRNGDLRFFTIGEDGWVGGCLIQLML